MSDIFLSYARTDLPRVRPLVIPQQQLDGGLMAREAELFGLFRSDEQIDYLHGDRFSFSALLEVLAGGKDLDILKQRPGLSSKNSHPAGRSS